METILTACCGQHHPGRGTGSVRAAAMQRGGLSAERGPRPGRPQTPPAAPGSLPLLSPHLPGGSAAAVGGPRSALLRLTPPRRGAGPAGVRQRPRAAPRAEAWRGFGANFLWNSKVQSPGMQRGAALGSYQPLGQPWASSVPGWPRGPSGTVACIRSSAASRVGKRVPLCAVSPHLQPCARFWAPLYQKDKKQESGGLREPGLLTLEQKWPREDRIVPCISLTGGCSEEGVSLSLCQALD